jgi:hypothetical protein
MIEQVETPLPPSSALAEPPDGGYGWVCVVAVFFINGFTWGIVAVSPALVLGYPPNRN